MSVIPIRLRDCKFCLVEKNGKKPFEKGWTDNLYSINDKKLIDWIKNNGNYGVVGGNNLIIIDFDNINAYEKLKDRLPSTFTVKSGGKGFPHLYFKTNDTKSWKIMDGDKNTILDLQGDGKQCVGANSNLINGTYTLINDVNIAYIDMAELKAIIKCAFYDKDWSLTFEKNKKSQLNKKNKEETFVKEIKEQVQYSELLNYLDIDTTNNPCLCPRGHDSVGGKCFSFNDNGGIAYCFHCDWTGDIIELIKDVKNINFIEACKFFIKEFKLNIKIPKRQGSTLAFTDSENPEDEIEIIKNTQKLNLNPLLNFASKQIAHLKYFKELEEELSIKGKCDILKKYTWYRRNSLIQLPFAVKINNSVRADNITHGLLIASAGQGKGLIKNKEKQFCKFNKITPIIEVSSISHPEQFIGKTIEDKKHKTITKKKGYLGAVSLMLDEADQIVNEQKPIYAETMRITRQSMDCYGDNEISKKLIDNSFDDALKYNPFTNIQMFMHPSYLENKFFQSGTVRRFSAIIFFEDEEDLDISDVGDIQLDDVEDNLPFSKKMCAEYKRVIPTNSLKYTQEALNLISDCSKIFLQFLICHGNKSLLRYGLLMKYSLKLQFLKHCNILHNAYNKETIDNDLVLLSCADTINFQLESIKSICKFGRLDLLNNEWFGLDDKEMLILEYLQNKGAISEVTSTVSISRFQSVISELLGVKRTQSRKTQNELKAKGFIGTKQTGKNNTCVWLKAIAKDITVTDEDIEPTHLNNYFKGNGLKNAVLLPLKQSFIDENQTSKNKGDKGRGNFDTSFNNNNYYTYQISKLLFNIYNYNRYVSKKPLPPLPYEKQDTLTTRKTLVKGDKTPKNRPLPLKSSRREKFLKDEKIQKIIKNMLEYGKPITMCDIEYLTKIDYLHLEKILPKLSEKGIIVENPRDVYSLVGGSQ